MHNKRDCRYFWVWETGIYRSYNKSFMLHRIQKCALLCNKSLLRIRTEPEYLKSLPALIVATCQYRFCWIGYKATDPGKSVVPMAQEGFEEGYLSGIRLSWAEDSFGRGPTGVSIRTGKSCAIQDILHDPRYEPWREAATKQGYASSAAIPLTVSGEVIGCLNLYSERPHGFPEQELSLLEDLAADISLGIENIRREEMLEASLANYKQFFDESPDGIFIADASGRYIQVNQRGCELLGFDESELLSMRMADLAVAGEDSIPYKELFEGQELVSHRYLRTKGAPPISVAIAGRQLSNGRLMGVVRRIRDFGSPAAVYTKAITKDPSLNLPDRFVFRDALERRLQSTQEALYLAVCNLDGFQRINDAFGRSLGLEFLHEIGLRIQTTLNEEHLFAYAGADEYYMLFCKINVIELEACLKRVLQEIEEPFEVAGNTLQLTASIGIAEREDTVPDAETFLNRAHTALAWAKRDSKNHYVWYQSFMEEEAREKIQMEAILTNAIHNNDFEIYLQGKFHLPKQELSGYEVLLRLRHNGQTLLPGKYIALAEETGLIHGMGGAILQKVCTYIRELLYRGIRIPNIAINLSPVQFQRPDLPESIARTMDSYELPADLFTLEITESALFSDPIHAIRVLRAFQEQGFRIAIDDFGTGFSSLGAIRDYPLDCIKIDRSFIQNLFRSEKDNAIVATITQMGETLGVDVVAEGVETEDQLNFLIRNGCQQAQGFLLHRPEPCSSIQFPRV